MQNGGILRKNFAFLRNQFFEKDESIPTCISKMKKEIDIFRNFMQFTDLNGFFILLRGTKCLANSSLPL